MIQAYCTSSTIATLYDLEKFICGVEKKRSFSEMKLGPLQKFPLVWHYFRFDHERQISELTPADIIRYLWSYGRGKNRIDLQEFLEHIAEKRDFNSPYDMGVLVNSIALAISVRIHQLLVVVLSDYNSVEYLYQQRTSLYRKILTILQETVLKSPSSLL